MRKLAEVVAFKQTDNVVGDLLYIFSPVAGDHHASVLQAPESEMSIFESLYIERRNSD